MEKTRSCIYQLYWTSETIYLLQEELPQHWFLPWTVSLQPEDKMSMRTYQNSVWRKISDISTTKTICHWNILLKTKTKITIFKWTTLQISLTSSNCLMQYNQILTEIPRHRKKKHANYLSSLQGNELII